MKVKKDKPRSGGHHDDQLLEFSFRFGHGLINDIKRKAKWYWSDFGDAYNHHTLPAIAFLYFACLAPIVTFGGLLGYATDNNMVTSIVLIHHLYTTTRYIGDHREFDSWINMWSDVFTVRRPANDHTWQYWANARL